jgi:hypothetical protein
MTLTSIKVLHFIPHVIFDVHKHNLSSYQSGVNTNKLLILYQNLNYHCLGTKQGLQYSQHNQQPSERRIDPIKIANNSFQET